MLPDVNIEPATLVATVPFTPAVQITWDAVPNATSYNVYRSLTEDGDQTLLVNQTSTVYVDNTATLGQTYYYRVNAVTAPNNTEVPVLIRARIIPSATPDITTIVTATPVNNNQINLVWTPVAGADSYLVTRSTTGGAPFTTLATTTTTSYMDTNLANNTTYYYQVTPYFGTALGTPSNIVSATTTSQEQPQPIYPCCYRCRCNYNCCNNNCNQCCCNNRRNWWLW